MIRLVVASVLAAAATLAGLWLARAATDEGDAIAPFSSTFVDVPMIIAPVFVDGTVDGYVLMEVGFEADANALDALPIPPHALLADALHGYLLGGGLEIGADGPDVETLREGLVATLNERLGGALVRTFVLRLDHLMRNDIRDGSLRRRLRRAAAELEGNASNEADLDAPIEEGAE